MSTDPHQLPTSRLDVTERLDDTERPATAPPVGSADGRSPRVRTIVFGAVMLVVALTVLVAVVTEVTVDAGAVVLVVLVLAGLALLGGGLAAAAKEARGGPGA